MAAWYTSPALLPRPFALAVLVLLAACPASTPVADAGPEPLDSGPPPTCTAPFDCRAQGFDGVCRRGTCEALAPCGDDAECGLGERCRQGRCVFTGCAGDADCPTGACRLEGFSCVECSTNAHCPAERPACRPSQTCAACLADADCQPPGPGHCAPNGACVHCTVDAHCPNGLTCNSQGVCAGAGSGQACPTGVACDEGLVCISAGAQNLCLPSCNLYAPSCPAQDICYQLTFSSSASLVFDERGPVGVCFRPQNGARGYREPCTRTAIGGSDCQPNLKCVPEDGGVSLCRTFCDPRVDAGTCPANERCHPFPGDFTGRPYGLCYPDNGWGQACTGDHQCRSALSCQPLEDPSAFDDLSGACQFAKGERPGLAPCGDARTADGGLLRGDAQCRSGACRTDPLLAPQGRPYFCFAACTSDADCGGQGVCDADFPFPAPPGQGLLRGCRPACSESAECARFDAGVACRARYVVGTSGSFATTCAPAAGALPPGASCGTNAECASAFCRSEDGRGSARRARCASPCSPTGDACPARALEDGGLAPLACLATSVLGGAGDDGVRGTLDDRRHDFTSCTGPRCTTDADCAADERCAPDAVPGPQGVRVELRCLPRAGLKPAGDPCAQDVECESGACLSLTPPAQGRVCFGACDGTTACPGSAQCRDGGVELTYVGRQYRLQGCAP